MQAVSRRVSYHTFAHVLKMDVSFHLDKRTGKLSRILERGPRSIQQIFRIAIFVLMPTMLEFLAVCTVLSRSFSPLVGGLVGITFVIYISWSVMLTQVGEDHEGEERGTHPLTLGFGPANCSCHPHPECCCLLYYAS